MRAHNAVLKRNTRGFTIIELMITVVVASALVLSVYGVMVNQRRAYTIQAAEISAQQSARAGLEILAAEFRQLSTTGGDIVVMDDDSVSLRVMRKFGLACGVTYSPPSVTVRKTGAWFSAQDSVLVYADGDEDVATDDVWIPEVTNSVDTTKLCNGAPAQMISLPAAGAAFAADSVRVGAPVRSFERVWFGIGNYGGRPYLGRWGLVSSFLPLVGPLDASTGPALRIDYYDINGNVTVVPADVYRMDIMVRSESEVTLANGNPVSDSLTVSVFARN